MMTIQGIFVLSMLGLLLLFYVFIQLRKYLLFRLRKYWQSKEKPQSSVLHLFGQEGII